MVNKVTGSNITRGDASQLQSATVTLSCTAARTHHSLGSLRTPSILLLSRLCSSALCVLLRIRQDSDEQFHLHPSFCSNATMTTPVTFITPQITSRSAERVAEDIDKYEVRKGRCQPQRVGGLGDASPSGRCWLFNFLCMHMIIRFGLADFDTRPGSQGHSLPASNRFAV
jgi:hypothetical protein